MEYTDACQFEHQYSLKNISIYQNKYKYIPKLTNVVHKFINCATRSLEVIYLLHRSILPFLRPPSLSLAMHHSTTLYPSYTILLKIKEPSLPVRGAT